ncbi:HNH endonuclease signature motif containing protein [Streptomyces ardesiacus]|uniref:HNH endonuclease n=1 Tax=Streptomyces ardesiacus TaxID=285564 RepID=UPI002FDC36B6
MTKRTCSVPGCERIHYGRGWCSLHYARWRIHGSTDKPVRKRPIAPPCDIEGCEQPSADQGLCSVHWHEKRAQQSTARQSPKRRGNSGRRLKAELSEPKSGRPCCYEDCGKKPVAKGLCSWHYQIARDARQPVCSVEGCETPERAKGLCPNHYAYKRRHGVPTPQFICEGCRKVFPGRANTRHCVACKPTPNFYAQERKARLALNNSVMTVADHEESAAYREIIKQDPCVYCGVTSVAIDHITPIVDGGSDIWTNLAPVCKPCNSTKRSRSILALLLHRVAA